MKTTGNIEELIEKRFDCQGRYNAKIIIELGKTGDERAIEPLAEALTNGNKAVRATAAQALGMLRSPGGIDALMTGLKDPEQTVWERAGRSLAEIGVKTIEPLLRFVIDHENWFDCRRALEALAAIGEPALMVLDGAIMNMETETRIHVIMSLSNFDHPMALNLLIRESKEKDPEIRQVAVAELLHYRDNKKAEAALLQALSDQDEQVRIESAGVLAIHDDKRALGTLIEGLKSENQDIRFEAVNSLGVGGIAGGAVDALIESLQDEYDQVRKLAAETLGEIGDKRAIEPLVKLMNDEDEDVREEAVFSISKLGDTRAIEPLVKLMDNESEYIRGEAVFFLGKLGDARALELLFKLSDGYSYTSEEANEVLREMSEHIPMDNPGLFCSNCFCRAEKHDLDQSLLEVISLRLFSSYYACRVCHSNSFLVANVKSAVLVLDKNNKDAKTGLMDDNHYLVHWNDDSEPFDYDEIWIKTADDYKVEKLVMKLNNDMDKTRRERMRDVPVTIWPEVSLSAAKTNLLKDYFQVITKKEHSAD